MRVLLATLVVICALAVATEACGNGGSCMNINSCVGNVRRGLCPGSASNICCEPKKCGNGGSCKNINSCSGTVKRGLCPGSASIICCEPKAAAPVKTYGSCSGGGTCQDVSTCHSSVRRGLCPGASNIICCGGSGGSVSGGGSCGVYQGKPTQSIAGNGGQIFQVVFIDRNHLSNPGIYGANPTSTDNTMTTATACAFNKLRDAAARSGHNIRINSGFRTIARQNYFWNCYQTKRCNNGNLAARPGTSNHGLGKALDLALTGSAYSWMRSNAQSFGFVRTVPTETWHWEYRPGSPRASYT